MQSKTPLSFLHEKQLAQQIGVSVAAIREWRLLGRGPRWRKLGRSVRYSVADVDAWLETRPTGGGHEAKASPMPEKAVPAGTSGGNRRITVSNWRPLEKGSLRGFLTLTLSSGLILNNCQLLETGEERWIGLPSQRFQQRDGSTAYVPIVEFAIKRARQQFRAEALRAVIRYLAEVGYVL